MHSATVSLSPGQIPWLQLLYSKSVRDLIQWSLRFLRDPQALSSTLASLGMLQPRAFGSLKMRRDLGLGHSISNYYIYIIIHQAGGLSSLEAHPLLRDFIT